MNKGYLFKEIKGIFENLAGPLVQECPAKYNYYMYFTWPVLPQYIILKNMRTEQHQQAQKACVVGMVGDRWRWLEQLIS